MCNVDGTDPFTMEALLCDDGTVRGGPMHRGWDYVCTGHAHFCGEHIRCTSQAHAPKTLPCAESTTGVVLQQQTYGGLILSSVNTQAG